ncbi:46228_t:CDS:2, partial [Gigaspora margarita]
ILLQTESSSNSGRPSANIWEEFNSINNGTGKHKGASLLRDIQSKPISPKLIASKKRKLEYSQLSINAYFDAKEAIDKAKEKRANQSLIKWIVSSGISFLAFDNPYFEDYTKALNPSYDPLKRTALATSILDSKAANIIIKVDKELSKIKNLTLCADSWCSGNKVSTYIHTDQSICTTYL